MSQPELPWLITRANELKAQVRDLAEQRDAWKAVAEKAESILVLFAPGVLLERHYVEWNDALEKARRLEKGSQ